MILMRNSYIYLKTMEVLVKVIFKYTNSNEQPRQLNKDHQKKKFWRDNFVRKKNLQ